ncbi:uncharacterized protein LOC134657768 [Cydia amplana]|uniref:uncharacterized protein LOC134657768 n=1 Tax=Cydia amplana TaxID=1869771 RepID=UPI002FE64B6E
MKFLWSLESIGITDSPKTTREEEAVKYFNETVQYNNGRYEVKWPWIQYPPDLPTNYGLAYGRLKGLLRRSDESTLNEYNRILKEQLDKKIIEEIEPKTVPIYQVNPPVHYLPHHIVKQEGKSGRIVYDGSAKIKEGNSLNECMYRGPSLLEDLTALLIKFRTGKVGITADVEKAFLQIGLQNEDRDVTRFLWVKDPSKELTDDNIRHFRFCRIPFGIISSPFLLTASIRYHITKTNEALLTKIADKCYVDNLVTSVESLDEALRLYNETRTVFNELSMNIRDWVSNDSQFMEKIPKSQSGNQSVKLKILGLIWNLQDDTLQLKVEDKALEAQAKDELNKKDILRALARVYDPCGFASPLILPAKLLFQDLCIQKFRWDAPLPMNIVQKWKSIVEKLKTAKDIKIPRYVAEDMPEGAMQYELHVFTDASKFAYSAVAYLRTQCGGTTKTAFLMSKSRVTPVEDKENLKIPRLELLGYLIGSRLLKYLKNNLNLTIHKQYLWTDSQVVLYWLRTNHLLPPFVKRRIDEINQLKDVEFCYINTNENPADLGTRPELWDEKQALWFTGPPFLVKDSKFWSSNRYLEQNTLLLAGEVLDIIDGPEMVLKGYEVDPPAYLTGEIQEVDARSETEVTNNKEPEIGTADLPDSLTGVDQGVITNDTKTETGITEILEVQKKHFPDEINGKKTALMRSLDLFLDVDGILRCGGRMKHTNWSYDKKHPILIPKNSEFTNRVIQEVHEKNYHVGPPHTLNIIREQYWIPQGKAQVMKVIKKCKKCLKQGGGPYKLPQTAALPPERVNYSPPFTFTGVDYFGPMYVTTTNGNREKRWVCLFTCLAVRAIHLELVKDLTAEECLLAVRRLVAARGIPNTIISDNALQFKLTSEILINCYCTENKIKWKFIPQLAPWHGGFYERLVGIVKHCLKRTLDKHLLNDSQLVTIIKEVESVVNTRPLTNVGADLEYVLKPADFLTLGKCLELTPSSNVIGVDGTTTKTDLVQGWKRGQSILAEFKKMFQEQYLTSLREKHRGSIRQPRVTSDRTPQLGDIVQIKEELKNRNTWKVGKITSLIKGQDGQCRVAKVKVGNTEFTRSIGHLYPLEVDNASEDTQTSDILNPVIPTPLDPPTNNDQVEINSVPTPIPININPQVPQQSCEYPKQNQGDVADLSHKEVTVPAEEDVANSTNEDVTYPVDECMSEPDDIFVTEPTAPVTPNMRDDAVQRSTPARQAAIRAKEKIAEWTRNLIILLQ